MKFSALTPVFPYGETATLNYQVLSSPVDVLLNGQWCPMTTNSGCLLSTQVIDMASQWTQIISIPTKESRASR